MKKLYLLAFFTLAIALPASALDGDVNADNEVNISDVNALINLILSGSADEAGDVNHDGEVNISDVNAVIDIILGGSVTPPEPPDPPEPPVEIIPKEIELDSTALEEPAEVIPDDEDAVDYGDYVENTTWATTVRINFEDDTVSITGKPSSMIINVEGAHVTVNSTTKRARFIVTGSTSDGSLKFYSDRKFQLQLNGVDITNPNGAAINNQCGKSLYLVVNEGTENTLRDGQEYAMVEGEDQKAAIFSEGQILVSGKGRLNVYSIGKHCMATDDYFFVRPGSQLYLNSTSGHGIKAKDYVYIKGGVINMEINADGCKGINCDSLVTIAGGRTTIINTGTSLVEVDSLGVETSTGAAGLKADHNLNMTGGTLNIKCTGDDAKGINVAQPFTFSGGELNVVCTGKQVNVDPKGVKCDTDLIISGGYFYSCAPDGRAIDVDGIQTITEGYTTLTNDDERLFEIAY